MIADEIYTLLEGALIGTKVDGPSLVAARSIV